MESKPDLRIPFEFRAPIETARLTIRGYRADDFDAFFSWRSRDDVTRYQDFDTQTREEAERSFSRAHERIHITNEGDGVVVALERREDARVIGDMVLFYDSALHDGAEIGWTLHPDYQGKGYATEAAQAMLRLAFETIGFHRVKANLAPATHRRRRCVAGSACDSKRITLRISGAKANGPIPTSSPSLPASGER